MSDATRPTNIGPAQRRKRRRLGAWALGFGVGLGGMAWALGAAPWTHILLSPLFFIGFLGVLQAREHT